MKIKFLKTKSVKKKSSESKEDWLFCQDIINGSTKEINIKCNGCSLLIHEQCFRLFTCEITNSNTVLNCSQCRRDWSVSTEKGNYVILGINQNQENVHDLDIVDDNEPENNNENNTSTKSMKTSGEKTRTTSEILTCVKSPNLNHSETIDVHDVQPSITLNLTNNVNENLPENNNAIHLADNNNDTNNAQPDDNNEISNSGEVNTSIESLNLPEEHNKYNKKSPNNNNEITTSSHEINTTTKS